jgi:phosphoserine aminotransferase
MLPEPVLERARDEMSSLGGLGAGVMEISHRSDEFEAVLRKAEGGLRGLLNLPDDYKVLFLSGGATLQFTMVPMNLLRAGSSADYIVTGAWGKKAVSAARRFGQINVLFDTAATDYTSIPHEDDLAFTEGAAYVHYTSNETIDGVEFDYDLDAHGIPVVCDASSNILSKPIDISKYAFIYAGAQKNIGPSGHSCDHSGRSFGAGAKGASVLVRL